MSKIQNVIKSLQNVDPISIAEEISGGSYKENDECAFLGMGIMMQKSEMMNTLMDSTDDTKFSETTEGYLRKVIDFGFEEILNVTFEDKGVNDMLYVLWHKEYSILLCFDTYNGSRNGGHFYYNWSPNDIKNAQVYTSSGGYNGFYWKGDFSEQLPNPIQEPKLGKLSWDEFKTLNTEWQKEDDIYRKENGLRAIWVGYHDCREALKNTINMMAENGTFLKEWKRVNFLWLLHYGDTKNVDYNYEMINRERYDKFPQYVKDCIKFK